MAELIIRLMPMNPEHLGPQERALFATRRMRQLGEVLDPAKDRKNGQHLMRYTEFKAVKTSYYGAYTFKNQWVAVEPSPEEVERVRARAAFTLWEELRELGYKDQADKIIAEKTGKAPEPLNRPPGSTPPPATPGHKK